ncbi:isochorismate synthase [Pontibacter sp. HSC-36F09]|uniref:isochorismate synthase n=1 Tax=Pontibacter sp. HSC-36F09 TaxID=2910966 RepID=UPI00209DB1E5|nr:isochorismate synthase [Pontibacter sp. HSC-36F09]MCP2044183.1 isochorismate synthase [Pontibacter sp. HSC-36F09]
MEQSAGGENVKNYTLEQVLSAALRQQQAIAVWRLPLQTEVQACISFAPQSTPAIPELEPSPAGFLFCPFETEGTRDHIFLKADITYSALTKQLHTSSDATAAQVSLFIQALAQTENGKPNAWPIPANPARHSDRNEENFKAAASLAVDAIRAESMEKVVLSRTTTVPLPDAFSLHKAFEKMLAAYPNTFVSLVAIPGVGTWLGATPEILVSVDQDKIFKTVALAGTQPFCEDGSTANAIWREKEIEEQGMVERYVLSCFKKLRLREYTEVGPRTVIAGNLMHLRTDFKVDLKEVDFPTLGTDMLRLLHPTSAVCGLPKEPALRFILNHEGYDRSYYSGFLGPVNSGAGSHLYVNLRCMQLLKHEAVLYAGAGVTGESSPEKEWQETQHKLQTMGKILADF